MTLTYYEVLRIRGRDSFARVQMRQRGHMHSDGTPPFGMGGLLHSGSQMSRPMRVKRSLFIPCVQVIGAMGERGRRRCCKTLFSHNQLTADGEPIGEFYCLSPHLLSRVSDSGAGTTLWRSTRNKESKPRAAEPRGLRSYFLVVSPCCVVLFCSCSYSHLSCASPCALICPRWPPWVTLAAYEPHLQLTSCAYMAPTKRQKRKNRAGKRIVGEQNLSLG